MKKYHIVQNVKFSNESLSMNIDGKDYQFALEKTSKRLLNASSAERERFEISASGYGIHWPTLDEDLSIDGLLGVQHRPKRIQKENIGSVV